QGITPVYAAVFKCPFCHTLLEAPAEQGGLRSACPACLRAVDVPRVDVRLTPGTNPGESGWFAFPCPACQRPLPCPTEHAGETVTCLHCEYPVQVPLTGTGFGVHEDLRGDPRRAIQEGGRRRCGNCDAHIPTRASVCPVCRQVP